MHTKIMSHLIVRNERNQGFPGNQQGLASSDIRETEVKIREDFLDT